MATNTASNGNHGNGAVVAHGQGAGLPAAPGQAMVRLGNGPISMRDLVAQPALMTVLDKFSNRLAQARGMCPQHLLGNQYACFAVVWNSINWNLNMFAVARSTYPLPGGGVGYEAKLVQAICESSGKMDGGFKREYYGDWSKVQGKHTTKTTQKDGKTKEHKVKTYTDADEAGLGVRITAKLKDRSEPDVLDFDLRDAFPRNSTLWATDPKTQLYYTALRRWASVNAPSLIMGLPGEDDTAPYGFDHAIDITPLGDPAGAAIDGTAQQASTVEVVDLPNEDEQQQQGGAYDPETGEVAGESQEEPGELPGDEGEQQASGNQGPSMEEIRRQQADLDARVQADKERDAAAAREREEADRQQREDAEARAREQAEADERAARAQAEAERAQQQQTKPVAREKPRGLFGKT